jgi:hypothetical protein
MALRSDDAVVGGSAHSAVYRIATAQPAPCVAPRTLGKRSGRCVSVAAARLTHQLAARFASSLPRVPTTLTSISDGVLQVIPEHRSTASSYVPNESSHYPLNLQLLQLLD